MPHTHEHIDGECYPSVTEIIHSQPTPWLDKWKAKYGEERCERKLKLANQIGTEFHRCVEEIMTGKTPEPKIFKPRVSGMLKSFKTWFDSVQVAPYANEMKVYSRKYRYQGTFDMLGEIDGKLYIVDYKSSSQIQESMGMQLAAYGYAYAEMTNVLTPVGKIVLVKKDKPDFRLMTKDFEITKKLFDKFLQLREELVELPCPFSK
jgi:ATP-dependent exoDNAse (exonuclease V) beta subunit